MAAGEGKSNAKHSKSTLAQKTRPPPYVEWPSSMQAYSGAGITPPFFPSNAASSTPYPYIWVGQHPMMPPFSETYGHPAVPMTPKVTTEMEIKARNRKERASKIKRKGAQQNTNVVRVRSGEGVTVASCLGNHGKTKQSVDSENDGSWDAVVPNYDPVAPMPSIASILNMGIDLWNPSAESVSAETSPNPSVSTQNAIPNRRARDGKDLKRQKRKQSNREAALRSRQRKQDEWEEQQAAVYALSIENHTLGDEIRMLLDKCNKLRSENDYIKDKINKI